LTLIWDSFTPLNLLSSVDSLKESNLLLIISGVETGGYKLLSKVSGELVAACIFL